ncbi:hypothetical protein [Wohlfahrtiimonas chitiniclastica]|nr:hypothetical protein [Wohlfahrtiimonas chitiniclastica]
MMTLSKTHCIIDCSGSMSEYGKQMLLVNLLRYIRQFTEQHNKDISYFIWQKQISEIIWSDEVDVELPILLGSGDTTALCNWSEEHPDVNLLVLTDGAFKLTKQQRHQLGQLDNLYLIGVGGDADVPQLKTLSDYCYCAEQLDYALHAMWKTRSAISTPPLTKVDLAKVVGQISKEEDDEW